VRLAFIPLELGIQRTITDRFDAFELTNSGHAIPILESEVPRIATLLQSAGAEALRLSAGKRCPAVK
jgi:hypothetical protein